MWPAPSGVKGIADCSLTGVNSENEGALPRNSVYSTKYMCLRAGKFVMKCFFHSDRGMKVLSIRIVMQVLQHRVNQSRSRYILKLDAKSCCCLIAVRS